MLEYWSPAPLSEGDAGKNAAAPAELKEPVAADLEYSSDSSVGSESDVEVAGASAPPHPPASLRRRRRHAVRKVSISKASMRGALPKGAPAAASRSGSEEVGADDAPQSSGGSAGADAARVEEGDAALGLSRMGRVKSPLPAVLLQPPAVPLKLTFNIRGSGG